jgi:IS30 family transposase
MPRVVKFKPRTSRKEPGIPKALKIGRSHEDFLDYTQDNGVEHWVEMDTVIGRVDGKTIMTVLFTSCNFMAGFLMEDKSSSEVARVIGGLKAKLAEGASPFGEAFPVILTDNGGEFANVFAIENDAQGRRESRLFFCDPYQSSPKPRVEKNHTLLRDIIPSGTSFDGFSQGTVELIFSHVNSVKRHGLNGRTAYEMFAFLHGNSLPGQLGIRPIPPQDVCQSPALLKT